MKLPEGMSSRERCSSNGLGGTTKEQLALVCQLMCGYTLAVDF